MKTDVTTPRAAKPAPSSPGRASRDASPRKSTPAETTMVPAFPRQAYVNPRASIKPSQADAELMRVQAFEVETSDSDEAPGHPRSLEDDGGVLRHAQTGAPELESSASEVDDEAEESLDEKALALEATRDLMSMAGASDAWIEAMMELGDEFAYEDHFSDELDALPPDIYDTQTKAVYALLRASGMKKETSLAWCHAGLHVLEYWLDEDMQKVIDEIYAQAEIPLCAKTFPKLIADSSRAKVLGKGRISTVVKHELSDPALRRRHTMAFKESSANKDMGTIAQQAGVYEHGFQPEIRNICFHEVGKALGFSVEKGELMFAAMGIVNDKLGLIMSEAKGTELGRHELNRLVKNPKPELSGLNYREGDNEVLRSVGAHSSELRKGQVYLIGTEGPIPKFDGEALFDNAQARCALSDLQMLCHLVNETDNNARNFFVDVSGPEPRFVRIDTDNGFGPREYLFFSKVQAHTSYFTAPRPPAISARLAAVILNEQFLSRMKSAVAETGLPDPHIEAFLQRCERVQDHLRSHVIRILETPQEWREIDLSDTQTSFVARFGRRLDSNKS